MTETEWLESNDPVPMLLFVEGKVSERKRRYFALACLEQQWGSSSDPVTVATLALAKQMIEKGAPQTHRKVIRIAAGQVTIDCSSSWPPEPLVVNLSDGKTLRIEDLQASHPHYSAILNSLGCNQSVGLSWIGFREFCTYRQAELLRDVIRGPFRPLLLCANWVQANGGIVRQLANLIYDERAFDHLPYLHDALVEAGCNEPEILDHCLCPGPHVRGCWVIDLLTGRQ